MYDTKLLLLLMHTLKLLQSVSAVPTPRVLQWLFVPQKEQLDSMRGDQKDKNGP